MTTDFVVPSKTRIDRFTDIASKEDVVQYVFDFTAWQADNATITGVEWTSVVGNVGITSQLNTAGVVSAVLTFSEAGRQLVSVLVTTGIYKKKAWLEVYVKDQQYIADDYGINP